MTSESCTIPLGAWLVCLVLGNALLALNLGLEVLVCHQTIALFPSIPLQIVDGSWTNGTWSSSVLALLSRVVFDADLTGVSCTVCPLILHSAISIGSVQAWTMPLVPDSEIPASPALTCSAEVQQLSLAARSIPCYPSPRIPIRLCQCPSVLPCIHPLLSQPSAPHTLGIHCGLDK